MNRILQHIPEAQGEELYFLEKLLETCDESQLNQFAILYRSRRKDPQLVLILAVIGLVAVPGIQRFVLNNILLGIVYLFTAGLCFIGSIVDLINHRELAFSYNQEVANEIIQAI